MRSRAAATIPDREVLVTAHPQDDKRTVVWFYRIGGVLPRGGLSGWRISQGRGSAPSAVASSLSTSALVGDPVPGHAGEIAMRRRFPGAFDWNEHSLAAMMAPFISQSLARFLEAPPFFFVATANAAGHCGVPNLMLPAIRSHVLRVIDQSHRMFPDFSGSGLFNRPGNIRSTRLLACCFLILRVSVAPGSAASSQSWRPTTRSGVLLSRRFVTVRNASRVWRGARAERRARTEEPPSSKAPARDKGAVVRALVIPRWSPPGAGLSPYPSEFTSGLSSVERSV